MAFRCHPTESRCVRRPLEYRDVVARLCERPGCSAIAEVAYGFDAEQLVVWLDGFHAAQGARSGVLCLRHADAMVVPLGWMLDDRREPTPRLFKTAPDTPAKPRTRRPRALRDATGEQLRLDPETLATVLEDDFVAPIAVTADETQLLPEIPEQPEPVAPWQPHFDETDDLKGLLNARGRLLSRAFNGVSSSE
ncbi:MAG: hypothetical protein RLZZ623_3958 [Actinomycetota bacterium]